MNVGGTFHLYVEWRLKFRLVGGGVDGGDVRGGREGCVDEGV